MAKKSVKWAAGTTTGTAGATARTAVGTTAAPSKRQPPPKYVRLRWGPSGVQKRVTLNQAARKAAKKAQEGAQRNAEVVERINAQEVPRQRDLLASGIQEEEEEDEEKVEEEVEEEVEDYDAEIDRREEENLEDIRINHTYTAQALL
jgi:hypothetical protein